VLSLPYYELEKLPTDKATGNYTAEGVAIIEKWLLATAAGKQVW
jgi:hypothetical protein